MENIKFDKETLEEVTKIANDMSILHVRLNSICRAYLRAQGKDPNEYNLLEDFTGLVKKE